MITPPPRLAERVLSWLLTDADRDVVAGDLAEEFARRVARDGPRRTRQWYWRQVRGCVLSRWRARADAEPGPADPRRFVVPLTRGLMRDIRYALRSLRSTPGFTMVVLAVLALGIGATTAIYSVVDGVALRGLPFPDGGRLVQIGEPNLRAGRSTLASDPDFRDWRAQQTTFDDLAASRGAGTFITREADGSVSLRVWAVSSNLFPLLQYTPALGRSFTADDEIPGRDRVAILSDAYWRQHFAGDPNVVGRTIAFEKGVWTVVGVMPASFMYPAALTNPVDLWVPYAPDASEHLRGRSAGFNLQVVGRRKRGVSVERARADIERITATLRTETPAWFRNHGLSVLPLQDAIVGPVKTWMLMLLGAVVFVLLIACVNVANLLLARATTRARDAAVRAALGASRWQILRGLLTESFILSIAGAAIGVALAVWGVHVLRTSLPPNLPRLNEVAVNVRVLLAAAVMTLAVALGVTPIWQTPRGLVSLRESGRSAGAGAARSRVRSGLLIAEVALAVVLVVGAGLFVSSFVRLMRIDLGFDVSNVLSVNVSPRRGATDADIAQLHTTLTGVVETVRRIPGVESAALVSGTPPLVSGDDRVQVTVLGKPPSDDDEDLADDKLITADYFRVLRVPIRRGRAITDQDGESGAPQVVVLNDVAAARYFGGADPVGASVLLSGTSGTWTVVGVVGSVRLQGPEGDLRPEIYTPLDWQSHFHGNPILTLLTRATSDVGVVAPSVRASIRSAAPDLPGPAMQTYDELFGALIAQRKFNMIVLALFGVLAIAIASIGIYGVMSYLVEQQTQEIGVRLALGAAPSRVLGMVLARATRMMAAGLVVGLTVGWLLSRFVGAFLFKGDPHDPLVYAASGAVLIAAGLLAAFVPARRASRVDPVVALRAL